MTFDREILGHSPRGLEKWFQLSAVRKDLDVQGEVRLETTITEKVGILGPTRSPEIAPCKRIRNPESSKFLLLESGIHNGLELWYGIWNPESICWDPESRGWDPESRTFVDSLT